MSDDKLAKELRDAYGRDLPDRGFDDAVMERTLADSGGEHEVAVDTPRGRRWWPFAVAAAMVLLAVGVWRLSAPTTPEPPPYCGPIPELAAPGNERIVVSMDAEGKTSVGGKVLTETQLKDYLTLRVSECRKDQDPQEPYLYIEGKARLGSPHLAKLLQMCAETPIGLRQFQFASGEAISVVDGELKVDSEPAPTIEDSPVVPKAIDHSVLLKRERGGTATLVKLDDVELGVGDEAFRKLAALLEGSKLKAGSINAWAWVPHADVIRAIDAFMGAGITDITFVGVPPAGPVQTKPRPRLHLCLQLVDQRVEFILYSSGGRMACGLDDGLVALDAAIEKLVAAGPKPVGFLDAARYIDQAAVEKVLEVFKKHGIEDVTIIR